MSLNKFIEFSVPREIHTRLRDETDLYIEVRCIRIDGTKNIYETTWPDLGIMKLNNETILEFKPLQSNSSLKKRKDEKLSFKGTKNILEGTNQIII